MEGVEEEEMNLSCLVERLSHVYCGLFLAVFYSSRSQNGSTCVLQELSRAQRLPSQYSAEIFPRINSSWCRSSSTSPFCSDQLRDIPWTSLSCC